MTKSVSDKTIFNCHIHTFTIKHVPKNYIHPVLSKLIQYQIIRKPLLFLLSLIDPFDNRDSIQRYGNLVDISTNKKQADILDIVKKYYPTDTRFAVMPMDMTFMGKGELPRSIAQQHEELANLAKQSNGTVIPFAAIDPRHPTLAQDLKDLFINSKYGINFTGIKLYPALGYRPGHDKSLDTVFAFADEHNLPVMVHCSRGGIRHDDFNKAKANSYSDPNNYRAVLNEWKNLRLCLGHFGGPEVWKNYLENPSGNDTWLSSILEMIKEYDNLYADISSTIFSFQQNAPILKVLLQDSEIQKKVLLGSDYYMAEQFRFEEKRLSINLRATLGDPLFWQIANTNPQTFF